MKSYPIWVDMNNNSYNSNKSYGIKDYAIQHVMIGTSKANSFDFCKIEMSVADIDGKKVYNLRVDNELIKSALYDTKTKEMIVNGSANNFSSENALKVKYFKKWKDEQEAKDQEYRNERFAHRLAVNGH